jgi:hypothetical protein
VCETGRGAVVYGKAPSRFHARRVSLNAAARVCIAFKRRQRQRAAAFVFKLRNVHVERGAALPTILRQVIRRQWLPTTGSEQLRRRAVKAECPWRPGESA